MVARIGLLKGHQSVVAEGDLDGAAGCRPSDDGPPETGPPDALLERLDLLTDDRVLLQDRVRATLPARRGIGQPGGQTSPSEGRGPPDSPSNETAGWVPRAGRMGPKTPTARIPEDVRGGPPVPEQRRGHRP
jgi:hypothetical protein